MEIIDKINELCIGNLCAKIPIVQGGMGVGISLSGLAAAVANQGGIGVIAASGIGLHETDFHTNQLQASINALRKEIRKVKTLTKGIVGVNIMVAFRTYADLVKTAIEEGIDIIFSGAGLPLTLPQYLTKESKTKLVPIVSSDRAFSLICRQWKSKYDYLPDAVVVEGPKAGGHLGFKMEQIDDPDYQLENIVPPIVKMAEEMHSKHNKRIPVIVGGGIYNGSDILKFLKMGASGVQMGTRFVATYECEADIEFKKMYLNAGKDDIGIIHSPVGMPGRAIMNEFLDDVANGKKKPYQCPYHCILTCDVKNSPYCIANAMVNACKGDLSFGFAFAGANAWLVDKIVSVKELMDQLKQELEIAIKSGVMLPSGLNN